MRRTIDAIAGFMEEARGRGARDVAAVGTAALRDAHNRDEFLDRVLEKCGLKIDVIPGEEEARLSFLAVRRDPQWRAIDHLVVVDVGGGSTELIQGEPSGNRIASRRSVNIGAVKLTERFLKGDPPAVQELAAANRAVAQAFAAQPTDDEPSTAHAVGVGGTLTNLAAIDLGGRPTTPEGVHGHALRADRLDKIIETLSGATVEERKRIPGLDPARADIILGGAILLAQALAHLRADSLDVSTRGLRWGVLYDRFSI